MRVFSDFIKWQTLREVNYVRKRHDLPVIRCLPRGHIAHGDECVLANCFQDVRGVRRRRETHMAPLWLHGFWGSGRISLAWFLFVTMFDHNVYPELVAEQWEKPQPLVYKSGVVTDAHNYVLPGDDNSERR